MIIFALLADPTTRYHDLGPDFYARHLDTRRRTDQLVRQLQALGHTVTLQPGWSNGSRVDAVRPSPDVVAVVFRSVGRSPPILFCRR
jgi:hypothetical protein